jgi:signal peptidase II
MFKGVGMKIKYLLLAAISGAIVTADQAAKMYVHTHFRINETLQVIPRVFNLTHVQNPGAAFGFLRDSPEVFREIFFLSMPPIALLIILAILRGVAERDRSTVISLSMVFGGAIGNYIDRVRFRYVVDFLDFTLIFNTDPANYKKWSYPAFNIADIAIVCGVAVLLFLEFTRSARKPETEEGEAVAASEA